MAGSQFTTVLDHIRRLVAPLPMLLSDHDLLQHFVRNRDEIAFAELMKRHARMVLSVCRRVLAHSQDAEDACQATFLVLARRASAVRGSVGGWLHAVAWRAAQRLKAQRARRPAEDIESFDVPEPDATDEVTWREVRLVLDEELQRLPDKYRAPLVLCYLEGMTQEEAARQLGWSCGVLRGRLDRGRERLRARLVRRGLGLSAALFGAGFAESAFAGTVPATVSTGIVRGALLVAANQAAAPGSVSAKVAAFAEETARTMIAMKLRSAALAFAALVVVAAGMSYSLLRLLADDPPAPAAPPVVVAQAAEKPKEPGNAFAEVARAQIDGSVVDEAGKPVAGAVVSTIQGRSAKTTRTAADGAFRLALDDGWTHYHVVTASADDGARQGIGTFDNTDLSQATKLRLVVKPARTMNVRVTDAAKKPVAGAAVGIVTLFRFLTQAQTDAGGAAALRFPADARVAQVIALKPGVGFDYYENYRSSPYDAIVTPPSQVTLTLDGVSSIAVRAVDSANKPVAGVELAPLQIQKWGRIAAVNFSVAWDLKYVSARTKDDGIAAFDWIPAARRDQVTFLHQNREYSPSNRPLLQPSDPEHTLVARMVRNVPISGKATLSDGKPAAGVLLQVEGTGDTNEYFREVVRTGVDGRYKLFVYPNQSYMIGVIDEQWAAPSCIGIVIREDEPREGVDLRLDRGTLIRGKVTIGTDKKPADRQTVTLREQGDVAVGRSGGREQLDRIAPTDDNGRYAIRVAPGRYELLGPGFRSREEITVKAGETVERDFHMDGPSRPLKGVVLAEAFDGKPVAGAVIHVKIDKSVDTQNSFADEQGRFELRRQDNDGFLYARNPAGTLATINRIAVGDVEVKIVISAAGKLHGRIVDKAGKPAAGVQMRCFMQIGPDENPNAQADLHAQTDDAGRFEFPGIVAGSRCRVIAYAVDGRFTLHGVLLRTVPLVQTQSLDLGELTFDPRDPPEK